MLRSLSIENYGLIAQARVDFARGATMFSGETGSGKTMVLGAIAFVLGERAGADRVRRGASHALVTLTVDPPESVRQRLNDDGFPLEDDEYLTLSREMADSGKGVLRVNGRPATSAYVRELAPDILDIVGQHEAQRLLAPSFHGQLLDRYAGDACAEASRRVGDLYRERTALLAKIAALQSDEQRELERIAYARFALGEIDAAAPQDGEDERLDTRRRMLENAEKITSALRAAHDALAGDERSASDALGSAAVSLHAIASLSEEFAGFATAADALQSEVTDLAAGIARVLDESDFDARELDGINARLDVLDGLKRKYGGALAAVIASRAQYTDALEVFDTKDERRSALERELQQTTELLEAAAHELSAARRGAADRLQRALQSEFKDLSLASARFAVQLEPLPEIGPSGAESIEFVFAANKGEPERPLSRVASGGELSRVLLALVVVLAAARGNAALVFDEIDTGIGGATANAVASRLGRLAQTTQVVCVTHLAQIASWADAHYVLEKREGRSSTTVEVRPLATARDRTGEVARMLSGEAHDVALEHARAMLEQTRERRATVSGGL